eukprot:1294059-Amphidinium_carterae.3
MSTAPCLVWNKLLTGPRLSIWLALAGTETIRFVASLPCVEKKEKVSFARTEWPPPPGFSLWQDQHDATAGSTTL